MRLAVCIKWAIDPGTVDIDPISGRLWEQRLLYRIKPSDRVALEQALRLRDRIGGQVSVFTVGPPTAETALREAIAMGADRILRIWWPALNAAGSAEVGRALAQAIRPMEPDLVLCGGIEEDSGSGLVSAMIAETLSLPCATGICRLEVQADRRRISVHRKLEQGEREVLECDLPALISMDQDLGEPIYPGLPGVMNSLTAELPVALFKTRQGPHTVDGSLPIVQLGPPRLRPQAIFTPDPRLSVPQRVEQIINGGNARKAGIMVEGSPELLAERIAQFLHERELL